MASRLAAIASLSTMPLAIFCAALLLGGRRSLASRFLRSCSGSRRVSYPSISKRS